MSATACVVACAPPPACILFWQRRLGSCHSQPVFWVGGGSPKTPRTEQRRRRSYHRSLELSSIYSVYSLGCRGTWQIKLGTKLGLRSPSIFFWRHRRVRCAVICYRTVAVSAAVASVASRCGSRFIASVVVVDNVPHKYDRLPCCSGSLAQ